MRKLTKEEAIYLQGLAGAGDDGIIGPFTLKSMKNLIAATGYKDVLTAFIQHSHNAIFTKETPLLVDGVYGKKTEQGLDRLMGRTAELQAKRPAMEADIDADGLIEAIAMALPLWREKAHDKVISHFTGAFSLFDDASLAKVHLNTRLDLAILLGQVREETGPNFSTKENLNYKASVLPKLFSFYRKNPALAKKHGRTSSHRADQVAIANHAYANRGGNGDIASGDGALFAGGGIKQVTFRGNYKVYNAWLKANLPDIYENSQGSSIMIEGQKVLTDAPHAVLSGLSFWHKNAVYSASRHGLTRRASDAATKIINLHTGSYAARWEHTHKAGRLIGVA